MNTSILIKTIFLIVFKLLKSISTYRARKLQYIHTSGRFINSSRLRLFIKDISRFIVQGKGYFEINNIILSLVRPKSDFEHK